MTTHAPGPMPSDLQQIPSVTDVGQHAGRGPTPGVALAAGRVPQAPTLPDFDPTSLTQALAQMANSLFQAPPPGSAMPEPVHVDTLQPSTAPSRAPAAPLHAGEQTAVPPPASAVPGAAAVPAPRTADAGIAPIVAAAPAAPQPAAPAAPVVSPAAPHVAAPASPEAPSPDQSTAAVAGSAPSPPFLGARAGEWGASPPNPWSAPLTFDDALFADQASHAPELASFRVPFVEAPAAPVAAPAPAAPAASSPRYATAIDPVVDTGIAPTRGAFDAHALRREFPILSEIVHGDKRLIWLDNAATTQKPRAVIERVKTFYERENSNIHRAAHALAARATDAYENARESTRRFLNAGSVKEIVFVRGATEGINLVAQAWGRRNVQAGDEIVLTNLEHHANIVPWQMLAQEKGARLRVAPVDDRGQIILEEYERLLSRKTRLVALPQVSNALGTVTPAQEMIEMAHRHGARVLLDGAQSVSHMRVDMQRLNPDFFVFSGHKIFGPTGIGAVYGKAEVLDEMPPWQGGGNMIEDVTFERTRYQPAPARFEAGTGNIADAVGLGAALEWLTRVGIENVERHEHDLLVYCTEQLSAVRGLRIIGTAAHKAGVVSFTLEGHSTQDVAVALDKEGIAVRGGHHCAQPILRRFGLESTVRASFAPYNVPEDIDALATALHRMQADRAARA